MNSMFNSLIMIIIICNTIMLAADRYPEPEQIEKGLLNNLNYVSTGIFTIEVIIKLIGLSPRNFFKEKLNIFDFFIVITSLFEIFATQTYGSFSVLRTFKLMALFKIFKIESLRILMDSVAFTITTLGNYFILLGLFLYVYALIGMQLFGGQYRFNPDTNF